MAGPLPDPLGIDTTAFAGMVGGALALILPQIVGRMLTHGDRRREAEERREDREDSADKRSLEWMTAALERCEEARERDEARIESLLASRDQIQERYYAAREACTCGAFTQGPDLRRGT